MGLSSSLMQLSKLVPNTSLSPNNRDSAFRDSLLLLVACAFLFFLGLGSYGLIDPGDGYFSEAAREMIETGDYVTPRLNYQIYFSKPILIYWLISSAFT